MNLCKRVVRMKCNKKEILNQLSSYWLPSLRTYAKSCGRHWAMQAPYAMPSGRYATKNTWWKIRSLHHFLQRKGTVQQWSFPADAASDAIQTAVLADERSEKWMEGKSIVKVIVVPKKIVNIVVK